MHQMTMLPVFAIPPNSKRPIGGERVTCCAPKLLFSLEKQQLEATRLSGDQVVHLETEANLLCHSDTSR